MDLIFFGMQGAGKGTVGKRVAEKFNLKVFETGAELRRLAAEPSDLGKKVKEIIEAGHLVSNEIVMEIVENFMKTLAPGENVLFDGIPSKVEQANSLNEVLKKYDRTYKAVILEISEDTALKRLTTRKICSKCKEVYPANYTKDVCEKCESPLVTRADDVPDAIKTRIEAFKKETMPAIEIYKDVLIKVNGEPTIEEVSEDSIKILSPLFA
jgi:adenylate kinase